MAECSKETTPDYNELALQEEGLEKLSLESQENRVDEEFLSLEHLERSCFAYGVNSDCIRFAKSNSYVSLPLSSSYKYHDLHIPSVPQTKTYSHSPTVSVPQSKGYRDSPTELVQSNGYSHIPTKFGPQSKGYRDSPTELVQSNGYSHIPTKFVPQLQGYRDSPTELVQSKGYRNSPTKSAESTNKNTVLFLDIDNKPDIVTDIAKRISKNPGDYHVFIFYGEGYAVKKLHSMLPCHKHFNPTIIAAGKEKNSADFVLLAKMVDLHYQFPPKTQFVIISGDRAFEEIYGFLQYRPVRVVSPHPRWDFNPLDAIFAPPDRVINSTELQEQIIKIEADLSESSGCKKITFVHSSKEVHVVLDIEETTQKPTQVFKTKTDHNDSRVFLQLIVALLLHQKLPKNVTFEILSPYKGLEEIEQCFKGRQMEITNIENSDPNPEKKAKKTRKKKRKGKRPK